MIVNALAIFGAVNLAAVVAVLIKTAIDRYRLRRALARLRRRT